MAEVDTYRAALSEARASFNSSTERLRQLQGEEHDLSIKIKNLRRSITALAALCSEDTWIDDLGITDSCLEAMEHTRRQMSTTDVVKALEEMGFDLASQKNVAASVHSVLSRLAIKGKIQKVQSDENRTVMWRGPNYSEIPDFGESGITDDDIPF